MTNPTRREYELAALAAGYELQYSEFNGVYTYGLKVWNPLNNDADAFRLAVDVGMDILLLGGYPYVFFCDNEKYPDLGEIEIAVDNGPSVNKVAATCKAIFDCAVAIGTAKEEVK